MLHIQDSETESLINALAASWHVTPQEAVCMAVEKAYHAPKIYQQKLEPILNRMRALPNSGLVADKEFYDNL